MLKSYPVWEALSWEAGGGGRLALKAAEASVHLFQTRFAQQMIDFFFLK